MLQDLKVAARAFAKSPAFAVTAALTLALGLGANTAIFTVVHAELLRPLPYKQPERLVRIFERNPKLKIERFAASVLNYLSWKERAKSLDSMGAISFVTFTITGSGEPEMTTGLTITPSLLPMLGITPVLGRGFGEAEDAPGAPAVAMISQGLWKRRFGADPKIIGKGLELNGVPYTVVGIAPPALEILSGPADIYAPLTIDRAKELRLNHTIYAMGRLRPGVRIEQAEAEMIEVARQVGGIYPEVRDWSVSLLGFDRWLVGDQIRSALLVLLGAVALVLLIACANVANLLLSRAVSRQTEIAVRTAIGASRGRIVRQLLTESVALALAGGIAGALLAVWAVHAIQAALPQGLLPISAISVDLPVLAFAFALTLATGVVFGLAPALQTVKTDLNTILKQGGRSSSGGNDWLRDGLAAGELALATVLLTGAGLLVQSLANLKQAPLGFDPERLLTFQVDLPPSRYGDVSKTWAFDKSLLSAIRAIPGVRDAAMSSAVPFGAGVSTHTPFTPVGGSILPPGMALPADWRSVTPEFFSTMRIPLLRGRDFDERDNPAAPVSIIVSRSMAQRIWGGAEPIGRVLTNPSKIDFHVVGVVADVRGASLGSPPEPTLYYPAATRQWFLTDVVVRTAGDPNAVVSAIRARLLQIDSGVPMATVRTMKDWISNSAAQPRLNTALLAVFAAIALLIAAIGIYGVLSYSVTQRTREIGLRMALGAQPANVVAMVLRRGMLVAGAGIAFGIGGASALTRLMSAMLVSVSPRDPATMTAAAIALTTVALAACYIPGRRASRVDPMAALREE